MKIWIIWNDQSDCDGNEDRHFVEAYQNKDDAETRMSIIKIECVSDRAIQYEYQRKLIEENTNPSTWSYKNKQQALEFYSQEKAIDYGNSDFEYYKLEEYEVK